MYIIIRFVTEMTSLRVKIITDEKQKRKFDGTVIYNLVGIDVRS